MKLKKKFRAMLLVAICSASLIAIFYGYTVWNSRAVLMSPRLGSPIRTSPSDGSGGSGGFLPGEISIWVATDPADVPIPSAWTNKDNWKIGLRHVALENMSLQFVQVTSAATSNAMFVSTGAGDSSSLASNAVKITFTVPDSFLPGLYDLHVGFKNDLSAAGNNIIPGSYQGSMGSGSGTGFLLSEPSCVYVPWTGDAVPSDPVNTSSLSYYPYSIIQISDIHHGTNQTTREQLDISSKFSDDLRDALEIMAPDAVVITGDLTRDPYERESEYECVRNWVKDLGIPCIIANGNHDQGNLGLWPYYFGPQTAVVDWGGAKFITFNSVLPISAEVLELITSEIRASGQAGTPFFTACHVPVIDALERQIQGSTAAILDAMVQYNGTGLLNGHNHYDLVMDARIAMEKYLMMEDIEESCEYTDLAGEPLPPIDGPKVIITTTGGYDGRDNIQEQWPSYIPTAGYRKITLADNRMVNYTYDMDGDGNRDPSYAQEMFNLNATLVYNNTNATYEVWNNLTESILGARASLTLPYNPSSPWTVSTSGVTERFRVNNGTHEYIDLRFVAPLKSNTTIELYRV